MRWMMLFVILCSVVYSKEINRYALLIGVNYGGKDRDLLRYAVSDAENLYDVLHDMGGMQASDIIMLREPDVSILNNGIEALSEKINNNKTAARKEVIIYYSGHANENGMLIGNDLYSYKTFRNKIDKIPAEVKITILDACASGAITRIKGGKKRKAFLVDESSQMKGYAFITSSADDEVSQESDKINGSYFTYYLVSGMRGAADINRDKRVTLNEAYQFAFQETLGSTRNTRGGVQHPSYDMKLTGTGDVVITDIGSMESGIVFDQQLSGRIFIRDENQKLIMEMFKTEEKPIEIGLDRGVYHIGLLKNEKYFETQSNLHSKKRVQVGYDHFNAVGMEETQSRGVKPNVPPVLEHSYTIDLLYNVQDEPFKGFQGSLLLNRAKQTFNGMQLAFINRAEKPSYGGQIGLANISEEGIHTQYAALINYGNGESVFQASGVLGIHEGRMMGVQASGVAGIGGVTKGVQASGVFSFSDSLLGVQAAGVLVIADDVVGIQVAGVTSIASSLEGSQFSGVLSLSEETGLMQVAGVANVTGKTGSQFSGVVNVSGEAKTQVTGVLNIADSVGLQVGVFNIAGSSKASIGLFNIVGDGIFAVHHMSDELGLRHFMFTTGTNYFYSGAGYHTKLGSNRKINGFNYMMGTSIGGDVTRVALELHQIASGNFGEEERDVEDVNMISRAQLLLQFSPIKYVQLYGGFSYNYGIWNIPSLKLEPDYSGPLFFSQSNGKRTFWPGFSMGVKMGFL